MLMDDQQLSLPSQKYIDEFSFAVPKLALTQISFVISPVLPSASPCLPPLPSASEVAPMQLHPVDTAVTVARR